MWRALRSPKARRASTTAPMTARSCSWRAGCSTRPVAGATVDVWHANSFGLYSFFGPPQSPHNLRRRIETDRDGRYRFRSIMPSGYGCPPGSNTETLLAKMGRHGQRPAHIHFFVTAPGQRQLTTQINIDGDKYLRDDFAFGTRDDLIPPVERITDAVEIHKAGLNKPFVHIGFDFRITREVAGRQRRWFTASMPWRPEAGRMTQA